MRAAMGSCSRPVTRTRPEAAAALRAPARATHVLVRRRAGREGQSYTVQPRPGGVGCPVGLGP